ncbi:hypothetical protein jhhlp_006087 [Lomentospora prolificans]|uniref:Uncharacterized protein n=1 Tax=Lomentospora prolificans TaxID=41688 RepID=A0A2N3N4X2_9PEZI|nr:hypothetical protein jhhlp_006087 [Lomentospora prolificans]
MAAPVDAGWSEHSGPPPPQTPSIEAHNGLPWDIASFSMGSFFGNGGDELAARQQMHMPGADSIHHLPHDCNMKMALESTIVSPSESHASPSAENGGIPSKPRKRKGTSFLV